MANWDRNKNILLELVKLPNNSRCADCCAPDPDWASFKLGIFVCLNCSGTHRNLPAISRIKSIRLDNWDDDLFMKANGNAAARNIYEASVPVFYYTPQHQDCTVLKEQWIRAKYERREFTAESTPFQRTYAAEVYEGSLWKKGKDNKHFLKRRFLLSQKDFTLKYFTKEDRDIFHPQQSKMPKAVIAVKDLNAVFQPEKIGHMHGLQISYVQEDHTRNLFVYHDNGQEIVSWFNAIRAARFAFLKMAFPGANESELVPLLTRSYQKEGYMEKTGPMHWELFKKRWFILNSKDRKLLYFKTPLDAVELGVIFIGSESHGYSVKECLPRGTRGNKWKCGVTMDTPDRQFIFMCEQEREQKEWVAAFQKVIARPMLPQDYATEASLRRRR
ncbi:arf-GAP with dual PH domain-containing protein 2 isoform X3 [Paramormyrops kingsleyae]|uniref:arf-GAP with dual PH domain-containing protein 2 isoform X3 n=1 Tax=Paramormyrops kingsleyae TaxID=1676925 RepID=UPI000CD5D05A|nr:arf-GAP with dual PH domain-containing protein 2 isoform X3 [Paramormyrops kingsleyae]